MSLIIDFRAAGNSRHFVRSGWSAAEEGFTWTMNRTASLVLPLSDWSGGYRCTIHLLPHIRSPVLPTQEMIISVRDIEIYRMEFDSNNAVWMDVSFDIPGEVALGADDLQLDFAFPRAVAPRTLGNSIDARDLGVAVRSLQFDECEIRGTRDVGGIHHVPATTPLGPPVKVAAVCMTYNEPEFVPLWLAHYARQVGRENCFILDDGSSDGSTAGFGPYNIIRLPRRPYDPSGQSAFNSTFCTGLLQYYDYVLYSDVDEFVVSDPKVAKTLADYCRRPLPPVITMVGLNIVHLPDEEPAWDPGRPILTQRRFVRFSSSMCKATLISQPVIWSPGSHSANARTIFDHLYLFHAKWFDLPASLRRQKMMREMAWAAPNQGQISRASDEELMRLFNGIAATPRLTDIDFDPTIDPVSTYVQRVLESRLKHERDTFKIALDIWADHLWEVPARFHGIL